MNSTATYSTNVVAVQDPRTGLWGFECDVFMTDREVLAIVGIEPGVWDHDKRWMGCGSPCRWPTAWQAQLWGEAACAEANETGVLPNLCDVVGSAPEVL